MLDARGPLPSEEAVGYVVQAKAALAPFRRAAKVLHPIAVPWGNTTPSDMLVAYNCQSGCGVQNILLVGSKPSSAAIAPGEAKFRF